VEEILFSISLEEKDTENQDAGCRIQETNFTTKRFTDNLVKLANGVEVLG